MSAESLYTSASRSSDQFPIRVLSERTGVGASTLRAWERRYGLLVPARTPKGHRLYDENDVQLIERILTLLDEGHSLPAIAKQVKQGTEAAVGDTDIQEQSGLWSDYLSSNLEAVHDFSSERIEAIFNEASSLYPVDMVTEKLIEPTLIDLGKAWKTQGAGIAEEHFYANWVRNRLGARFHHASGQANGVRIVCACAPGVYHEIGLMLFSISALTRGYRVLYFGADLPLDQIPVVVSRSGARGVVLASRAELDVEPENQLASLVSSVGVPVFLGGTASDQPIPRFEAAGGTRLGSRISIALRVLGTHLPVYGSGYSSRHAARLAPGN